MRRHIGVARTVVLTVGMPVLVTFTGCIFIASDESKAPAQPTVGRQLSDLKTARDKGAINDQEFQQTKAKLLSDCK